MEGQLNLNLISGEEIILADEVENAEKLAKEYQKAINRAQSLINDAKKRYIKEKTRARSKKAAEEREAVLKSSRFKDIEIYDRREDILDAYGWGIISMEECDRLEALWDEREEIRNHIDDNGIYQDLVTQALGEAENTILNMWEDEIFIATHLRKEFNRQKLQAEEEYREWKEQNDKAYEKLMGN